MGKMQKHNRAKREAFAANGIIPSLQAANAMARSDMAKAIVAMAQVMSETMRIVAQIRAEAQRKKHMPNGAQSVVVDLASQSEVDVQMIMDTITSNGTIKAVWR